MAYFARLFARGADGKYKLAHPLHRKIFYHKLKTMVTRRFMEYAVVTPPHPSSVFFWCLHLRYAHTVGLLLIGPSTLH